MATAKKTTRRPQKQTPDAQELLLTELREIYSAESQLTRALPRLSRAVESEGVRRMFDQRLEQGQQLLDDLEGIFEEMDATRGRKKNPAAEGLIADAQEHVQEIERGPALDAVLVGAMQKTEHYCIAAWGASKALGELLGEQRVVQVMQRVLDEGKQYDEEMTRLAMEEVNPAMMAQGEGEEEEGEEPEARASGRGGRGGRGEDRGEESGRSARH